MYTAKKDNVCIYITTICNILLILVNGYFLSRSYCTINLILFIIFSCYICMAQGISIRQLKKQSNQDIYSKWTSIKVLESASFALSVSLRYLFDAIKMQSVSSIIRFLISFVFLYIIIYALSNYSLEKIKH